MKKKNELSPPRRRRGAVWPDAPDGAGSACVQSSLAVRSCVPDRSERGRCVNTSESPPLRARGNVLATLNSLLALPAFTNRRASLRC